MNAEFYVSILQQCLLPFLQRKFADRFMQDNDPKHVSWRAKAFFEENEINWWRTPPESPDLNPIENLWHELKEHLRAKVKPRNQHELVTGIKSFWSTVDVTKCRKYIGHLRKGIPRVIELQGDASGYFISLENYIAVVTLKCVFTIVGYDSFPFVYSDYFVINLIELFKRAIGEFKILGAVNNST